MLPYDKFWINKEQKAIEKTIKKNKKKTDNYLLFKYLIVLGICTTAYLSSDEITFSCPYCNNDMEIHAEVRKGNWECPKCGYLNDNRMRYCSTCGYENQK